MGAVLQKTGCTVVRVDAFPLGWHHLEESYLHDLNDGPPKPAYRRFDYILLLDVLEHLAHAERFLNSLVQDSKQSELNKKQALL